MVTTIQLSENVKMKLDKMKSEKETYEDVIVRFISKEETEKEKIKKLLEEGYKEFAEESLKITKEFEAIEDLRSWKWDDN